MNGAGAIGDGMSGAGAIGDGVSGAGALGDGVSGAGALSSAGGRVPRVGFVIGRTTGGTGRHAAMLARGCLAARGEVSVFGQASTGALFPAGCASMR